MNFVPHWRRPAEPAYSDALAETRAALASTCDRLVNCSSSRLPGRAVGSLCELQRATDHLQLAKTAPNGRAHHELLEALHDAVGAPARSRPSTETSMPCASNCAIASRRPSTSSSGASWRRSTASGAGWRPRSGEGPPSRSG